MPDALPKTLDVLFKGMQDRLHLGATLYVSLGGKVVAHYVLGEAEPGRLLRHSSACPWLSAGKPSTAAGVAWLWERKLVKLDDPVVKFIPSFVGGGKEAITLRHCLTHQAGLRAAISAWTRQTSAEILAQLSAAEVEKDWVVGRSAGYHVASTWYLLGEVIRVSTGKEVGDFLKEAIWGPLGMSGTALTYADEEWDAMARDRLLMHDVGSTAGLAKPPEPMSWEDRDIARTPRPGSGVRGPVADLAKFYEFMLGLGDSKVLSHTTRAAMTARHRVGVEDQTFKAKVDWGLGFVCESSHYGQLAVPYQYGPHASPRTFGHSGNQSSVGMADPEHGLAVALVFNGMCGAARHDARQRAALAAIYEDLGLASAPGATASLG
jgi:CubicO group peptidase (beta-lactamase class C family)